MQRRPGGTGGAVGSVLSLPRPGPKMYSALVWWVFGLYALFFAKAPYTPSIEAESQYNELMSRAMFSDEGRMAQRRLEIAQRDLDEVHVFGWRWREPYRHLVPPRQRAVEVAQQEFMMAVRERDAVVSEAKATVGIWSTYGVEEVRNRFWGDYQWGKDFAKRMTFWDLIFGIGGGRDEEFYVTILRMVGQVMMNFTVGLISALVCFAFSLVRLIWEYKTNMLSGLLFFFVAMSGASAMVALFVGGMVATAVGGVYAVAQSQSGARLEGRGAAPRVRHQRHHYE